MNKMSITNVCERIPPMVGYYEIIKFIDPRLNNITFSTIPQIEWNYPLFYRYCYRDKDDDYKVAHDKDNQKISKPVVLETKGREPESAQLYLCKKSTTNGNAYYFGYETTSFETPPCNCHSECGFCCEEVGYLDVFYEYVSDDMETAIFKYLDMEDEKEYRKRTDNESYESTNYNDSEDEFY